MASAWAKKNKPFCRPFFRPLVLGLLQQSSPARLVIASRQMDFFKPEPETAKKKKDYQIGEIVGKGAYGVVKEAIHIPTKRKVAIKVIEKSTLAKERKNFSHVQAEFGILSSVKHPNVIQFLDWFETKTKYYLVYELASGGELFRRIVSQGHFSERECVVIISTILNSIVYLHSHNLVHRDLKPENLLFKDSSEDSSIVIVDFGVAKLVCDAESEGNRFCKTFTGSPAYMAPEVIDRKKYGKPVDVWSVGVIAFVLLSGRSPWGERIGVNEIYRKIAEGKTDFAPAIWSRISPAAQDFCASLMQLDPDARPTAHEALHHPWLEKLCPKGYIEYIERFNVTAWQKEGKKCPEHIIPQWNHVSADPRTASRPIRNHSSTSSIASTSSLTSTCSSVPQSSTASNTLFPPTSPALAPASEPSSLPRPAILEDGQAVSSPAMPTTSLASSGNSGSTSTGQASKANSESSTSSGTVAEPEEINPAAPASAFHTPVSILIGTSGSQTSRIQFADAPPRTPSPSDLSSGEGDCAEKSHEKKYGSFGRVLGKARRMSLKHGELNLFEEAVTLGATYGLGGGDSDVEVGEMDDTDQSLDEKDDTSSDDSEKPR
ncbi:Pkinase-domain-containing protein [Gonapodya prolifera JEL478]|uniref:Pkinase-domain-containing protein n=1 Tax=Gonapodya prolifera (strain JEL478) TaxID=1344416 RepID=A0A139A0V4_GONPJ|nr:Pkinase-domain-containing protein [Gonapodya prolifera JEL478]|eukprot:KXS10155.1 Pkinase-domain-containing protein [Gonapodya prolifera JEL478]